MRGPTKGSLCNRIRTFFLDNPGEELTYRQIEVKFDCTPAESKNAISEMRKKGWLESITVIRVPELTA